MPSEYTIQQIIGTKEEWGNDYGRYTPYELLLSGGNAPNATVDLNRKQVDGVVPDDKVPKVGDTLFGTINKTDFGYRFKAEQKDQWDNGQQSISQPSSGQARTDATGRSIERQVAAKIAGTLITARLESGMDLKDRPAFAEEFHFLTDTIADAIKGNDDASIPFS